MEDHRYLSPSELEVEVFLYHHLLRINGSLFFQETMMHEKLPSLGCKCHKMLGPGNHKTHKDTSAI